MWPGSASATRGGGRRCGRPSRPCGFRVEHSEASLYLWATRDESCWDTVADLSKHGILVAPGGFYGAAGERYVRIAFTATDERVAAAVRRLSS